MNINRNNYEEYFLLYVDNELSVAEKKNVETFVQQNADLRNELLLLQNSTLKNEEVVFGNKDTLLRNDIGFEQIQENLLLHLDNESDANDTIDELITNDESIATEWNMLQKTKSYADVSILFENKASLYRTESGKVVLFPWKRIVAAAAILIGIGLWGYISFFNNSNINNVVPVVVKNDKLVKNPNSAEKTIEVIAKEDPSIQNIVKADKRDAEPVDLSSAVKQKNISTVKATKVNDDQIEVVNHSLPEKSNNVIDNIEKSNNVPGNKSRVTDVAIDKKENEIPDEKNSLLLTENNEREKINDAIAKNAQNAYASTAALNTESINEDRVFYMKETTFKKTRVGSLFGKAKKLLNKVSESSNIALGNIEIALK